MPTKGERGKATDFSIAAIMAPRGPSFGHYHLQGIGNAAATADTRLECPADKEFVAESTLDNREFHPLSFFMKVHGEHFIKNCYDVTVAADYQRIIILNGVVIFFKQ